MFRDDSQLHAGRIVWVGYGTIIQTSNIQLHQVPCKALCCTSLTLVLRAEHERHGFSKDVHRRVCTDSCHCSLCTSSVMAQSGSHKRFLRMQML